MKVKALKNRVLVDNMKRGERKVRGFWIPDDDGKEEGVRPRWARVFSVGEDIDYVEPGQWVMVDHGRWTRGISIWDEDKEDYVKVWRVEPESIMLVSDSEPEDETVK